MGKTTTWMVNMEKLVGQGELGGLMVRLMMALQEQITRSRSFSAVVTCQDHLRQASLDLVRSVPDWANSSSRRREDWRC